MPVILLRLSRIYMNILYYIRDLAIDSVQCDCDWYRKSLQNACEFVVWDIDFHTGLPPTTPLKYFQLLRQAFWAWLIRNFPSSNKVQHYFWQRFNEDFLLCLHKVPKQIAWRKIVSHSFSFWFGWGLSSFSSSFSRHVFFCYVAHTYSMTDLHSAYFLLFALIITLADYFIELRQSLFADITEM